MNRLFTKNSTGIATDGRWYAGDVNALQDAVAAKTDLTQALSLASIAIGESGLLLVRYGSLEARLTGALRTDGIVRALGGLYGGAFTTTQRDAIAAGFRPYGLMILNTTNNRYEFNAGTDATPNWIAVGPASASGPWNTADIVNLAITAAKIANNTITAAQIAPGVITTTEILDGTITAADISATLKPSGSAAAGTEALRALGATASTAAAGLHATANHARTGADPIPLSTYIGSGILASRPSTGLVSGMVYTATDVNGGTSYLYTGAAWIGMGSGVTGSVTTTINAQVGTSYTAVLADRNNVVTMNNAAANTFTIPPNSSVAYNIGDFITIFELGAGITTIAPGAGVTVTGNPGLKLNGASAACQAFKIAIDTWLVFGNLTP